MHAIDNSRYAASRCVLAAVLSVLALCLGFAGDVSAASGTPTAPVKSVAQITFDDDGLGLKYPSAVFFDSTEEEIYLVNGGTSRVVVYGPDFFPRVSIGAGRSIAYPRGVFVTSSGQVYICQGVNRFNPVRRITILNGAFFVAREIFLDEIPEAGGFSPRQVAVNRDGIIYLTSDRDRGVLVLDKEGNFLRWLKPMDLISDRQDIAETTEQLEEEEKNGKEGEVPLEGAEPESPEKDPSLRDIPDEFRPRSSEEEAAGPSGPGLGPVKINHVVIDSAGNLYLLSTETSKIYVYSPDETFLFSFGQKGGTPRTMSQPRSFAIDDKNKMIYVADYTRHTILVYDMSGKWLFEFGGRGFKPGYFNFPISIAVNRHGHVIVADLFNKRVQVLDVEYEGLFPSFGAGEAPTSPQEEAPENAGKAAPGAGSPAAPEEEAGVEAAPDTAAPAQPDGAVEEVIIPAQDLPVQPDAGSGQEVAPGAPAEQPAVGTEEKPAPVPPPGQPAAPGEEKSPPAGAPDHEIEEKVLPEQILPASPDDKV